MRLCACLGLCLLDIAVIHTLRGRCQKYVSLVVVKAHLFPLFFVNGVLTPKGSLLLLQLEITLFPFTSKQEIMQYPEQHSELNVLPSQGSGRVGSPFYSFSPRLAPFSITRELQFIQSIVLNGMQLIVSKFAGPTIGALQVNIYCSSGCKEVLR